MTDIVDIKTRSRMMSGIRSTNTKPEILTRKALHKLGYRFRLNSRIERIKPDIVLSKYKVAVFVHGCYWHKHEGCKLAYSNRNYSPKWLKKFEDNRIRDSRVLDMLVSSNWRVVIIWECVTRNSQEFRHTIKRVDRFIKLDSATMFESDYVHT